MDHELFCKIKPRELIAAGRDIDFKSKNLVNYITWERNIINWLVAEITSQENQKLQIQTVERILSIGQVFLVILIY